MLRARYQPVAEKTSSRVVRDLSQKVRERLVISTSALHKHVLVTTYTQKFCVCYTHTKAVDLSHSLSRVFCPRKRWTLEVAAKQMSKK